MKIKNFKIEDKKINIIFQDDNIIVINKKDGLLSHCNRNYQDESVVSLLKFENAAGILSHLISFFSQLRTNSVILDVFMLLSMLDL